MKTSDPPISLNFKYDCSVNEVWSAITNHPQMVEWYFDNIPDFKAIKGFKTQFVVNSEDRQFTHIWEVTSVVPYHSICYTWKYPEYQGFAGVCFKIDALDSGVNLNLELIVLEDFPIDIPEFKRDSCIAGWEYFLGKNLANYLAD